MEPGILCFPRPTQPTLALKQSGEGGPVCAPGLWPPGPLKVRFSSSALRPPVFLATAWAGSDLQRRREALPRLWPALVSWRGLIAIKVRLHLG